MFLIKPFLQICCICSFIIASTCINSSVIKFCLTNRVSLHAMQYIDFLKNVQSGFSRFLRNKALDAEFTFLASFTSRFNNIALFDLPCTLPSRCQNKPKMRPFFRPLKRINIINLQNSISEQIKPCRQSCTENRNSLAGFPFPRQLRPI